LAFGSSSFVGTIADAMSRLRPLLCHRNAKRPTRTTTTIAPTTIPAIAPDGRPELEESDVFALEEDEVFALEEDKVVTPVVSRELLRAVNGVGLEITVTVDPRDVDGVSVKTAVDVPIPRDVDVWSVETTGDVVASLVEAVDEEDVLADELDPGSTMNEGYGGT
jgi:hypothetical protein